jgi:hypothetical protein
MKNAGRAAKYFERTFNYTLRETRVAKKQTGPFAGKKPVTSRI